MTFAWYAHLKNLNTKPIWIAISVSWFIALFEYIFQVPANRIGYNVANLSLEQLKIMQEVITLAVFIPFAAYYMREPISWNFVVAGICMLAAVYFIFFKPL
jgi:uncharacterized protein (DUF486 family)